MQKLTKERKGSNSAGAVVSEMVWERKVVIMATFCFIVDLKLYRRITSF